LNMSPSGHGISVGIFGRVSAILADCWSSVQVDCWGNNR